MCGWSTRAASLNLARLSPSLPLPSRRASVTRSYFSIPQRTHATQLQAISSIATYAAISKFFIIVAPETTHADTGVPLGANSYLSRGWCRLEQWAAMAASGPRLHHMLLYDSMKRSLTVLTERPEWVVKSVQVFLGNFTRPSDRACLVDVVLGVYAFSIAAGTSGKDGRVSYDDNLDDLDQYQFDERASQRHDAQWLANLVIKHRHKIFPPEWFGDMIEILEMEMQMMIEKRASRLFSQEDFIMLLDARQQLCELHGCELPPMIQNRFQSQLSSVRSPIRIRLKSVARRLMALESTMDDSSNASEVSPTRASPNLSPIRARPNISPIRAHPSPSMSPICAHQSPPMSPTRPISPDV